MAEERGCQPRNNGKLLEDVKKSDMVMFSF